MVLDPGKGLSCVLVFTSIPQGRFMRFGSFLLIAFLLFFLRLGGFVFFHVASAMIHLLLLVAIISLVIHFVPSARAAS
jgi:Family of unknown function (DUF5670)